ncbi:MAG: molybdate ABC transporter substrate-binding protein [Rhodanobacteraceae bacterium]|nr:MAG: molybdate ABC transporter substrate-binding protein [Rhodanobacteraceae bacterium]
MTRAFIRIARRGLALFALCMPLAALAAPPTIFAAASLQPALDQMAHAGQLGSPAPQLVYASSAALARQIESGAPADIFISADERWMNDAAQHGAVLTDTRVNLLGNALVLIAPADSHAEVGVTHGTAPFLKALGKDGRLAIALPDSVPAGIYARQSLTRLGLWQALQPRMAMARDVRAALNLVVLRQCPLGIVYRSDAVSEPRVKVLATFPAASHKPIVYPVAIVKGHDNAAARALLAALESAQAGKVFRHWGFTVLPEAEQTVRK